MEHTTVDEETKHRRERQRKASAAFRARKKQAEEARNIKLAQLRSEAQSLEQRNRKLLAQLDKCRTYLLRQHRLGNLDTFGAEALNFLDGNLHQTQPGQIDGKELVRTDTLSKILDSAELDLDEVGAIDLGYVSAENAAGSLESAAGSLHGSEFFHELPRL